MKPDLSSLPEWSRPWAEHRLAQVSHDISVEQWSSLGDWLTVLPIERPKMPAKLHKLTMAQALQASVLWHEDMSLRAERIRVDQDSFGGDPNAFQVLADGGQGWRWVRITSPEGLDYEGNAMGHCVGRGGYDSGVTIISLRDKHNMPHCTIEWDMANRSVKQIQGRANGPVVEKYHEAVVSFINGLEPLAVQRADKFDHAFVKGQLVHCNKLPDGLSVETLDLAGCTALTHLPNGLNVKELYLSGCTGLTHLPNGLVVEELDLWGCTGLRHLPDKLTLKTLDLMGCTGLTQLPDGLSVKNFYLRGCTGLTYLPDRLVAENLHISGCTGLTHLPDGLSLQYLNLEGGTNLTHLPDGLNAKTINISACTGLTHLPNGLTAQYIYLTCCTGLTHLPDGLTAEYINLRGCNSLTCLPDGLSVKELDIRDCTGITFLPSDLNPDCRVFGGDHLVPRNNPGI